MSNELQIKVGMFILMQSSLEEAVSFYSKIGFKLAFHLKDKWAEFNVGSIKLGLCPSSQPPFDRHTGIVLEVNDLNAFLKKIKEVGIESMQQPIVAVHGIMANIKDPSGNIIDIYQPTPEKLQKMAQEIIKDDKYED